MRFILDIATAPLPNAADFIDPPKAPSNWKDQAKIDAYVAEKLAERTSTAGLDPDLCCITAVGVCLDGAPPEVRLCREAADEIEAVRAVGDMLRATDVRVVGYNILDFDLPVLMRRAKWLGVKFPIVNVDRYRTPHLDLMHELSGRNPERRRSLAFYIKRHGWGDLVKPLSGEEEAAIFTHHRWDDLADSVQHDLEAVRRLVAWWEGR